jgi:hypothetical protein
LKSPSEEESVKGYSLRNSKSQKFEDPLIIWTKCIAELKWICVYFLFTAAHL